MSSQKAKGKQVIDTVDDDNELSADESGGSEPEQPANEPAAQTTPTKKKKKKKSKLAKMLNPISGAAEDKIVETVLEKVKAEHADTNEDTVRAALQQLNLKDVISGKSGLGGKNQKDTGGHKVRDYRLSRVECTDGRPLVLGYPACPTVW
jgi:glycylpeptide N-tetradecanoyltransferase